MMKWTKVGLVVLLILSLGLGIVSSFFYVKNEANLEKIELLNQEVLTLEDKVIETEESLNSWKNDVKNVLENSLKNNNMNIRDINVVFSKYTAFSNIDIEIAKSSSFTVEEVYAFALLSKEKLGEAWTVMKIIDKNGSAYTVELQNKKLSTSSKNYYFDDEGKLTKEASKSSYSYSSSSSKSSSSKSSSSSGSTNYRNGYEMPNENDKSFSDYVKRVAPDLYDSMKENYPD